MGWLSKNAYALAMSHRLDIENIQSPRGFPSSESSDGSNIASRLSMIDTRMAESIKQPTNTFFIEVSGAGIPAVDGLFVPSTAPPSQSESGTVSSLGYWNGRMAWDRADGKSERSPALSYSNTYKAWRICRADGHLAYELTCKDQMPPTDRDWSVYKKGVAPAPQIVMHYFDPRQPCPKPNVIFVLGGPGAGKGTMCELAESQLGWVHLSTGELLRAEHTQGGIHTAVIEKCLAEGVLVPDEIIVTLLKQAMETVTRTTGKTNFLLDGFPRSLSNLEAWFEGFGQETSLPKMLFFECPFEVLEQRILSRAKYTGRSDDNLESLKIRFDTFQQETLPTVQYFRSHDKCINIDTSLDRQVVYQAVASHLAEYTDEQLAQQPLTERAEMLLGIRPFPKSNA